MRLLVHVLSILSISLLALPLVASSPYYPYPKRMLLNVSYQLANRAYLQDASQFNFDPYNITNISILCARLNPTVNYSCNLTCKRAAPSAMTARIKRTQQARETGTDLTARHPVDWFDPNSVRQNSVTSGSCQTSWAWDGVTKHNATLDGSDPVAEYHTCWVDSVTSFRVAVPAFWHPGVFSLELSHHYRDDE
jgi:hypothetical protein